MDDIDLFHLAPCTIVYVVPADMKRNKPALSYSVEVSYSDHCYTKGDKAGGRVFDPKRYELSKRLPNIIAGLMDRRVSFAFGMNFITIEDIETGEEYEVYFSVVKRTKTKTLGLIVRSAYVRDPDKLSLRPKQRTVKFATILFSAMNGKTLHPPIS